MKMPKLLARRFRKKPEPTPRPYQTQLKATAVAPRREAIDNYDGPEPTTSLSTAFIIVLVLHVVAVGGIYIFNSIKASRPRTAEQSASKAPPKSTNATAKNPPQKQAPAPAEKAPVAAKPVTLSSGGQLHRVLPNENLTKIATLYGVTLAALEDANALPKDAKLKVDQQLNIPAQKTVVKIPVSTPPLPEPTSRKAPEPTLTRFIPATSVKAPVTAPPKPAPAATTLKTYTVDKGDTATYIARRFNVSTDELLKLNGITDPKKLQPGKVLKVPTKTTAKAN